MIQFVDRKSGALSTEKIYGHKPLALLYGDSLLSKILYYTILPLLAHLPLFSRIYGHLQKTKKSRNKIAPFIRDYGIDASEFEPAEYHSFNDFFIRKLKRSARPIDPRPEIATLPADGRYLAYPRFDRFFVKGQSFSIESFLQNPAYAKRFETGSMLIARLCPVDYHRFHFPCDGIAGKSNLINGPLYSVNPIALKKRIEILSENKRVITEIDSDRFGTVLYVEVGATAVGTIRQTFTPGRSVRKGEEKGYFEFGGSCLILLFEEGRIQFDSDLVENTRKGFETYARFGESLGRVSLIS
jgi:phosphatidylserine decarboxylase